MDIRKEFICFSLPVTQNRGRADNQRGKVRIRFLLGSLNYGQALERLPETHVVSQNSVEPKLMQERQPVESMSLVLSKCQSLSDRTRQRNLFYLLEVSKLGEEICVGCRMLKGSKSRKDLDDLLSLASRKGETGWRSLKP